MKDFERIDEAEKKINEIEKSIDHIYRGLDLILDQLKEHTEMFNLMVSGKMRKGKWL